MDRQRGFLAFNITRVLISYSLFKDLLINGIIAGVGSVIIFLPNILILFFCIAILKGADAPFVMELPPYRVPMLKSLLIHMWDRSKMFLKKMGGIILVGSVIIWALSAFPQNILYSRDYATEIRCT